MIFVHTMNLLENVTIVEKRNLTNVTIHGSISYDIYAS